ncbi:hypothetical protein [Sporisorium scitamineum]|uniref:Uncharacterized protein n=1 Tax=Sporisorium scitamineum TaxID=49012 RepID=A0A0F7S0S7_9BASI|nr:hypothetical protein [Sporisorium scitamineum]
MIVSGQEQLGKRADERDADAGQRLAKRRLEKRQCHEPSNASAEVIPTMIRRAEQTGAYLSGSRRHL